MEQLSHPGQIPCRELKDQASFNLLNTLNFHNLICNVTTYSVVEKMMEKIWLHFIKTYNSKAYRLHKSII